MNWKQRYTDIKKGDKVKLIKYHVKCGGSNLTCCRDNGYKLNKIYKVYSINEESPKFENRVGIKSGKSANCFFPEECFEKVL